MVKFDLVTGAVAGRFQLPRGDCLVSEPTFVPKDRGSAKSAGAAGGLGAGPGWEEEGYLLLLSSRVKDGRRLDGESRLLIVDAAKMEGGAVAQVRLPADLPYGLHSEFVPWEALAE